jgi:hypothetical protein
VVIDVDQPVDAIVQHFVDLHPGSDAGSEGARGAVPGGRSDIPTEPHHKE